MNAAETPREKSKKRKFNVDPERSSQPPGRTARVGVCGRCMAPRPCPPRPSAHITAAAMGKVSSAMHTAACMHSCIVWLQAARRTAREGPHSASSRRSGGAPT